MRRKRGYKEDKKLVRKMWKEANEDVERGRRKRKSKE